MLSQTLKIYTYMCGDFQFPLRLYFCWTAGMVLGWEKFMAALFGEKWRDREAIIAKGAAANSLD